MKGVASLAVSDRPLSHYNNLDLLYHTILLPGEGPRPLRKVLDSMGKGWGSSLGAASGPGSGSGNHSSPWGMSVMWGDCGLFLSAMAG